MNNEPNKFRLVNVHILDLANSILKEKMEKSKSDIEYKISDIITLSETQKKWFESVANKTSNFPKGAVSYKNIIENADKSMSLVDYLKNRKKEIESEIDKNIRDQIHKDIEEKYKKTNDKTAEIKALTEKNSLLTISLQQLKTDYEKLNDANKINREKYEADINELNMKIKIMEEANKKIIDDKVKDLEKQTNDQKEIIVSENSDLKIKNESINDELEKLKNSIKSHKEQIERELKTEKETEIMTLNVKYESELQNKTKTIEERLKLQYEQNFSNLVEKRCGDEIKNLNEINSAEKEKLKEENTNLQAKIATLQTEINMLKPQLEQCKTQLEKYTSQKPIVAPQPNEINRTGFNNRLRIDLNLSGGAPGKLDMKGGAPTNQLISFDDDAEILVIFNNADKQLLFQYPRPDNTNNDYANYVTYCTESDVNKYNAKLASLKKEIERLQLVKSTPTLPPPPPSTKPDIITEIENLKTQLQKLTYKIILSMTASAKLNKDHLSEKIANMANQSIVSLFKQANDDLAKANTKLEGDKATLTGDKATLTADKATLTADKATLTAEKIALTKEKTALTAENATLKTANDSLTKEKADLTTQIKDLTTTANASNIATGATTALANAKASLQKFMSKDNRVMFEETKSSP